MIQPNLVCKKEHKQNKIALTLNNYNKYYDNTRFDKLDLVIEHDETIINDLSILSQDQLHLSDEVTLNKVAPAKKKFTNTRNTRHKGKPFANKNKNYTRSK